jgi:MtrB/PioB family decaheme-associated outer membrane protein
MPKTVCVLTLAVLLTSTGRAGAQEPAINIDKVTAGTVDFGARVFDVTGDPARDQRYRDLRSGPSIDRVRYTNDQQIWVLDAGADHVGYRDQRYFANYRRAGRVKASFEWNEIPLFNSTTTSSPLVEVSTGVFRLDDTVQSNIQSGAAPFSSVVPLAKTFDLRSRREIAAFHLDITPAPSLDLKLNVTSTARKGAQPWGVGFGFSNVVEVPAPLKHRTTDIGTAVEWGNSQGMLRVGYDGSWFRNPVESLIVDNPLRVTDIATDTSQGRMALWPSSSANSVNTAGSIKFPGRSRATAYLSVGNWKENAALIPYTINTAIAPIPLDRPTAEADARITAMNYTVTSSPAPKVWLNARFKRYDFDNRTPEFHITNYVRTDQVVSASRLGVTEPLGYVRDNFDADASYSPLPFTALRLGYSREEIDRTHRYVEKTTDNIVRGTVDFSGNAYVTLRGVYEHSKRTGTGLDEEVLDEIGEQATLRQFDISDRDRDRVSAIVQLTPIPELGITASIAGGNDRRPEAEFGLTHNVNRVYAFSVDAVPRDGTSFGASYGFEDYKSVQNSRQANPGVQFEDPTRNWSTNGFERVHTANVSADLLKIAPKTEVRLSYDFSRSKARYDYVLPVNTTLAAVSQLPPLFHELHHGVVDARYLVRRDMSIGLVYWYDRYRVDDFALDSDVLNRIDVATGLLLLANSYRPYRSNMFTVRLTYLW